MPATNIVTEFNCVPEPAEITRSALVIVDMQYATGHETGPYASMMRDNGEWPTVQWRFDRIHQLVIPNIQRLLSYFRSSGGKVVFVTVGATLADCSDAPPHMRKMFERFHSYIGSPNHSVIAELTPLANEPIVNKTSNGVFATSVIDTLLRVWRTDQLYFVGVSTDMCVGTSAREAADRGYQVVIVEDATATNVRQMHELSLAGFQQLFGRVLSTDDVCRELAP